MSGFTYFDEAEAERRARACTLSDVSLAFDDLLQENLVIIADEEISDEQLFCLAQAFDATHYTVQLPEAYQAAFAAKATELAAPRSRATWIAEWERLGFPEPPHYDPDTMEDTDFARTLEDFCGSHAKGAFGSEFGPRMISPEWHAALDPNSPEQRRAVSCVMLGAHLSGFEIGIIGNEKEPE
ncbi:hypothetical protein [Alteraurantiacibacter aquimixticola]|uniref:Uncharacterized protein n=1 Tax=Alteraurantiacibacter aquimixticola TaxID=2489173 RepID=A0A4T3F2Y9_9SPHN|nr:hypothetical protein [Alteraurantiacibacter aquimixticola]TIX50480.1 hypothetical protein E5222_09415 [Alteraurantiacibacter aquimixticola]